ncbi:hypothetical protein O6H91_10G083500 [Diphasiastrum complanatum]|uniref:Uncharacterized protein n=1 Tax=Diphasiastrum complanatum TaxID=34168 RepID=A0ACC2CJ01_DIPCM|nr:hypothetical protein O6H91_10G083500 [Diphasiastrum complanatum]
MALSLSGRMVWNNVVMVEAENREAALPFTSGREWRNRSRVLAAAAAQGKNATVKTSTRRICDDDNGPYEEGKLSRPSYTGDSPLSRFVSMLISMKPLYSLMKVAARQVLINTAEKKGVPWRQMSEGLLTSNVYAEKPLVENASLVYPDYYLKDFHAYEDGNLSWKAASEVKPATLSMIRRAIPDAKSMDEAMEVLRGNWLRAIEEHHVRYSCREISDILDIGCSVGTSTLCLADKFPAAQVTGLDLSPYFIATAQYTEKQKAASGQTRQKPIHWIHANGEATGLPPASFDVVSFAYVIHECPQQATKALLQEAYRLLRPGGTIALTDNSPKSKVIQDLPPVLFTLMKSTEPWMDEYYSLDLEQMMHDIGLKNVTSILTDPRHRTVTGTVPNHGPYGAPQEWQ